MRTALLFDFTVDKEKNAVKVTREFAAERSLVWEAWTNPEIMDLWWAPKPYRTVTTYMDLRPGGYWLYYMISPEGQKHYCRADYKSVHPKHAYSGEDAFCNAEGIVDESFPRSLWDVRFEGEGDTTTVHITITYQTLEDLEKIVAMGFKEGFTMALGNLDQYIEERFRLIAAMHKGQMPRVTTYLNFPGNTEAAFLFYREVFQTEFTAPGIQRFGELPPQPNQPPVAENLKNMVLHVELPILANHVLMGTDAPKEMGFTVSQGNNMHISLEPDSRAEAKRLFDALSKGGKIDMPLQEMFWGAYFGSFSDAFGINWMINCRAKN
jgi:PhnB protein